MSCVTVTQGSWRLGFDSLDLVLRRGFKRWHFLLPAVNQKKRLPPMHSRTTDQTRHILDVGGFPCFDLGLRLKNDWEVERQHHSSNFMEDDSE